MKVSLAPLAGSLTQGARFNVVAPEKTNQDIVDKVDLEPPNAVIGSYGPGLVDKVPADVRTSAALDMSLILATKDLMPAADGVSKSYTAYMLKFVIDAYVHQDGVWEKEQQFTDALKGFISLLVSVVKQTAKYDTPQARKMLQIEKDIPDTLNGVLRAIGEYCSSVAEASFFPNTPNEMKMDERKIEMRKAQVQLSEELTVLAVLAQNCRRQ